MIGDEILYYPLSDKSNLGKPVIRELGPFIETDVNGNDNAGKLRVAYYDERLDTDNFTFSTWFNSSNTADGLDRFIYHGSNGVWASSMRGYNLYIRDNSIRSHIHNGATYINLTYPLTVGVWIHVAVTYDAHKREGTLYINGRAVASGYGDYQTRGSSIGKGDIGADFLGAIDDSRFFDRAVTQEEITAIMAGVSIGEETIRLPQLMHKKENDILLTESVGLTDMTYPYFRQGGLNSQQTHYMSLPWSSRFYSDNFSISFWTRGTNIGQYNFANSNILNFAFWSVSWGISNALNFTIGGTWYTMGGHFNPTSSLNEWKHVVLTFKKDGTTRKSYLNGSYHSQNTNTALAPSHYRHIDSNNRRIKIGALNYNAALYFHDFRFYDRVLDEKDVSDIYTANDSAIINKPYPVGDEVIRIHGVTGLSNVSKIRIEINRSHVENSSDAYLHVAEVRVYNTNGDNIALGVNGSVATQSTTHSEGDAEDAIDGDTATYNHTLHDAISWLEVKFPYAATVSKVVIVNRSGFNTSASTAQERSRHPTKISLLNPSGKEVYVKNFRSWPSDTQQFSVENVQYSGKITEDSAGPIEIVNDSSTQHASMRRIERPTPLLTKQPRALISQTTPSYVGELSGTNRLSIQSNAAFQTRSFTTSTWVYPTNTSSSQTWQTVFMLRGGHPDVSTSGVNIYIRKHQWKTMGNVAWQWQQLDCLKRSTKINKYVVASCLSI